MPNAGEATRRAQSFARSRVIRRTQFGSDGLKMTLSGPRATLQFRPMKTAGTQHLIERTYREGGTFQWVREATINAIEAGATRIEFGIEWQAAEQFGVYRRTIADNGRGMTPDELEEFFNTFGGGGKPIGGVHENFGVGAKTSLLPWNRAGVVVVSWSNGQPTMIWMHRDGASGEYGLRVIPVQDDAGNLELGAVYGPYRDQGSGCDWNAVRPDWIDTNGTVIVLMGNDSGDDTVLGDPSRDEGHIKGISSYLNRRLWVIPDNVQITVDELRYKDKKRWPSTREMASKSADGTGGDPRNNLRKIRGARRFIVYEQDSVSGSLASNGSVSLSDGTIVDWYLWSGERPEVHSYAARGGYIAALYRGELYDVSAHHSTYRAFGIGSAEVRKRCWLILRPPELDDERRGVYPRTDRNALLLRGGPNAGGPLPVADWGAEFADCMPDEIRDALSRARGDVEGTLDETWRDRLAERFGDRWRIPKRVAEDQGKETVEQSGFADVPRKRTTGGHTANPDQGKLTGAQAALGVSPGDLPAARRSVSGGIPTYRYTGQEDFDPGMLASWQPKHPDHPEGIVWMNRDHPVIIGQLEYWKSLFAAHHAEDIEKLVMETYGQVAVAKVAHSEHLRGLADPEVIKEMRSERSLTMALLGLISEEAFLSASIGGRFGRRRT